MIRTYRPEYEPFVLALGSPEKSRTDENPLTATERREIIHACFPDLEIVADYADVIEATAPESA